MIDLYSRRLLGAATSRHSDAEMGCAAVKMAVTARGARAAICCEDEAGRVIVHTDRGSVGEFPGSSQHLDDGGVSRWHDKEVQGRKARGPLEVGGWGWAAAVGG